VNAKSYTHSKLVDARANNRSYSGSALVSLGTTLPTSLDVDRLDMAWLEVGGGVVARALSMVGSVAPFVAAMVVGTLLAVDTAWRKVGGGVVAQVVVLVLALEGYSASISLMD
jgi:hypothetical protein